MKKYFTIGLFLLTVFNSYSRDISFKNSVPSDDTLILPPIQLKQDSVVPDDNNYLYSNRKSNFEVSLSFHGEYFDTNFDEFKTELGKMNTDEMNKDFYICFNLGVKYKSIQSSLGFNSITFKSSFQDSLDIKFTPTNYRMDFGYRIVDTRRFLIMPRIALRWDRYRLINNDKTYKIPLNQYVANRDLDIKFNQMTGFLGLDMAIKVYEETLLFGNYWVIGIFGGYNFKINDKPWIYSEGNRLTSDNKINIGNYTVGISFSLCYR